MRSPKTVFVKPKKNDQLNFYIKDDRGNVYYMFTESFNEPACKYFGAGLSWNNLKNGLKKKPGRHIGRIIEKIHRHAKYVMKYEAV